VTDPRAPARLDDELAVLGFLRDPVRRSLYLYVAAQSEAVGRDEAAEAVGVQRKLAAFHLDKLIEAGLLEASYRRLSGREGPGAGRPAKLYRPSSSEHAVSVPPRQYDLAADLLATAVEEADGRPARESLSEVARRFGRRLGEQVRTALSGRATRERRLAALATALDRYGYQPRRDGGSLYLGNCPFHTLSRSHEDLVCGMNLSLFEGVVDGMGCADLEACQESKPGQCCVTVAPRPARR
jgi:predicted ArsR family transcriptional regulator